MLRVGKTTGREGMEIYNIGIFVECCGAKKNIPVHYNIISKHFRQLMDQTESLIIFPKAVR